MKDWSLRVRPLGFVVVNGGGDPVSPGFRTREAALDWFGKRSEAQPPKRRACLRCGSAFESAGKQNRMCPRCSKSRAVSE